MRQTLYVCIIINETFIASGFSNLILKSVNFEHIIIVPELKGKNTNVKTDLSIIIQINLIITMKQNSNKKCMVNEEYMSNIDEILVFNFYYKINVSNFVYIVIQWLAFFVGSLWLVVRVDEILYIIICKLFQFYEETLHYITLRSCFQNNRIYTPSLTPSFSVLIYKTY